MMKRVLTVVAGWLVLSAAVSPAPRAQQPVSDAAAQRALLDKYCVTCHNEKLRSGNLRLDTADVTKVGANGELWEKVVRKLRGGLMPPPGRPRPDAATYDGFASWLEHGLDAAAA